MLEGISGSLGWDEEEFRRLGHRVINMIADYLSALPDGPVFRPFPEELSTEWARTPAPQEGEPADAILDQFSTEVAPYPFGNGHPRFFGWVNSPPAPIGILAEALASAMNPRCAGGNHAAVYLERQVVEWFRQLVGFPVGTMGLLVSGGSMATLTALAVARHAKVAARGGNVRAIGLQGLDSPLVLYMSEEGHSCIRKAAELMGIGSNYVRIIPSDENYRMRVDLLRDQIASDADNGLLPFAVVASAGTVNTGAIDPLTEIAQVCRDLDLWLHVDGAYGAPALLSERHRSDLQNIALADSLAVDPHKWLYIPVEAGLVVVRNGEAMRDAFSLVPPYLRTDGNPRGVNGPPWLSEYGFQQTRGFRALKIWMALKFYGAEGYAQAIERNIAQARYLAGRIENSEELELAAPQNLSIVTFRYAPPALRGHGEVLDSLNKALLEEIQLGGKAFLSSTTLKGRFALRACIVNFATSRQDIDFLFDLVRAQGQALRP